MSYNKTQLHPEYELSKHVFHRDQFAHFFRWSHVLKIADINWKILDFGCGNGNLLEVLWRNKYKPSKYLGLDIRGKTIESNREKFKHLEYASFECTDLCKGIDLLNDWDLIVSFETIEHIGKENADKFLTNIKDAMNNYNKYLAGIGKGCR